MNPLSILSRCTQAGVCLQWNGSTVKAVGDERALRELLPLLKAEKQALQEFFASDEGQSYEERAAIMEFDGGMSQEDAETKACEELYGK